MGFFGKKNKAGKKDSSKKAGSSSGNAATSSASANAGAASKIAKKKTPAAGTNNPSRQRKAAPPKAAATPTPPKPPTTQQKVIKIIGDEKHVTTTTTDAQGRLVNETTITKLTPTERLQHQHNTQPPAPQKAPPPNVYQPHQPPMQQEQPPMMPPASMEHMKPPTMSQSAPGGGMPQHQAHMHHPNGQPMSGLASASTANSNNNNSNNMNGSSSNATGSSVTNMPVGNQALATIEITRDLVKRFISDIWNRGEIELIPEVCHPSLRFNGHVGMDRVGHDGFARMVTTVRDALTDYHCEIHSMVVETNKAFCRLRFTGKHTGVLLGFPPTGKTVAWMGASEFTCKNGKILKVWELGDVKSLEEQLKNPN